MDRLKPTRRPAGRCRGFQRWSDLSFLHWPVPEAELRELVPAGLEIDTFGGTGWLGIVPFYMSGVRPRGLPAVPGLSNFCETNVRTYVHCGGEEPGVWFFSLDARNRIAVAIARTFWNLNYRFSKMELERQGSTLRYRGCRPGGGAEYRMEVEIDTELDADCRHAEPGTLEHFLAERYLLYAEDRRGRLLRGQVHHSPYPLLKARTNECVQNLIESNRLTVTGPPAHTLFSPGVKVEIFGLQPVAVD